jgi:hypothetical protein
VTEATFYGYMNGPRNVTIATLPPGYRPKINVVWRWHWSARVTRTKYREVGVDLPVWQYIYSPLYS